MSSKIGNGVCSMVPMLSFRPHRETQNGEKKKEEPRVGRNQLLSFRNLPRALSFLNLPLINGKRPSVGANFAGGMRGVKGLLLFVLLSKGNI